MKTLEQDLADLLNSYSQENNSNTPDFILAEYLMACLRAFTIATRHRTQWYRADDAVSDLAEKNAYAKKMLANPPISAPIPKDNKE